MLGAAGCSWGTWSILRRLRGNKVLESAASHHVLNRAMHVVFGLRSRACD